MAKLNSTTIYGSANVLGSVVTIGPTFDISSANGLNLSNSNSISSVVITNNGQSYQSQPTVTFSNTTTGGVTANANAIMRITSSTAIGNAGVGYANGDILYANSVNGLANASFTVTDNTISTFGTGGIRTITINNTGLYFSLPNWYNTANVLNTGTPAYLQITGSTSAAGSGANIALGTNGFVVNNVYFANYGAGYVEPPTVTFSGGNPTIQSTGYAYVGGGTNIRGLGQGSNFGSINFYTPSSSQSSIPALAIIDGVGAQDTYFKFYPSLGYAYMYAAGASNSGLAIGSNGSGAISFNTQGGNQTSQARVTNTTSAVNYVNLTGATTSTGYGGPVISAAGSDANISLVLQPKGTGSLQAQPGDGTTTNGNPRGTNAVDFQTQRSGPTKVASGTNSVIGGGYDNQVIGNYAVVSGGYSNSMTSSYGFIGAGVNNINQGYKSIIVGGDSNAVSSTTPGSNYSFLGGGVSNSLNSAYSVLVGGLSNSSLGAFNFIGGGAYNTGTPAAALTTATTTIANAGTNTFYLTAPNATVRYGMLPQGTGFNTSVYTTSAVTTSTSTLVGGSISGTTLTFTSSTGATVVAGMVITGTGVTAGTYIVSGSGLSWTVNNSQTSTPTTATAYTFTTSVVQTVAAGTTVSFYIPHGVVVGGGNNTANGSYSFVGGGGDAGASSNGNKASGDWSFIGGGQTNTASGNWSSVMGGQRNIASGIYSSVWGGAGNLSSGYGSGVLNGSAQISNGTLSAVLGGQFGTARAINGNIVFASGCPISYNTGLSQASLIVLGAQTTTATPTVLTSDPNGVGTTNQVILPNNSAYYFKGSIIANVTGAVDGAAWSFEGAIMRGANAGSTILIGTPMINRVAVSSGASLWTVALSADTSNGGLAVTVTGTASTTIRWVAKLETTEVTY
jgi:hypothetical protein